MLSSAKFIAHPSPSVSIPKKITQRTTFTSVSSNNYKGTKIKRLVGLNALGFGRSLQHTAEKVLKNSAMLTFLAGILCPLLMRIVAVLLVRMTCGLPAQPKESDFVDRTKDALDLLLRLNVSRTFFFLYGSHAIGKSHLVRLALRRRPSGGCVYVLVEEGVELSMEDLASKIYGALGCSLLIEVSFVTWFRRFFGVSQQHKSSDLFTVRGFLASVGGWYKWCFKQSMMVVIDGVNSLPEPVMRNMLGVAKNLADQDCGVILVFVGTAGQLPHVCARTSALSRGTFIMLRSILDKDLEDFIHSRHKIPSDDIKELLSLVGGKAGKLINLAEQMSEGGKTLQVLKREYMDNVYNAFALAGLHDLENIAWVTALLRAFENFNGELHVTELQSIVPRSEIWKLNAGAVFTIDESKVVRYECEAHRLYAQELLARIEKRETNRSEESSIGRKKAPSAAPVERPSSAAPVESPSSAAPVESPSSTALVECPSPAPVE